MKKISKYDRDPGRRDRMIANGDTNRCAKCHEDKHIDEYYWQKAHNAPAARCKVCWKQGQRERFNDDWEFRERHLSYIEGWMNKGGRERVNEVRRERYANDPEYRAKILERRRVYLQKKRDEKE